MQSALKLTARVLPGNRIEVIAPELVEGEDVELIVMLSERPIPRRLSVLDIIESLPSIPRLFATPDDADRYLQEERDSWDR